MGIKSVPKQVVAEGKRRKLKVLVLLENEIEGVRQQSKRKSVQLMRFTIAPGYDPIMHTINKHIYNDYGLEWDNSGRNGFYSRLKYKP